MKYLGLEGKAWNFIHLQMVSGGAETRRVEGVREDNGRFVTVGVGSWEKGLRLHTRYAFVGKMEFREK